MPLSINVGLSRKASRDFQSQYGLMTDAYTPKPAFFQYRDLVARYSR